MYMEFILRACGIIAVALSPLVIREFPRLAFFYHFLTVFTVLTTVCIKLVLVLMYSVDTPPNSFFFIGAKLSLLLLIATGLALAAGAFLELLLDLFCLDLRGSGPGSHPRFRRHLWKVALWARSKSALEKTLHTVVLKVAPVALTLLPLVPIGVYERHECHTCWLDVEACAGRRDTDDDEHTGVNSRMFMCEGAYKASIISLIQLAIIVIVFLRYAYNVTELSSQSRKPSTETPRTSPQHPALRSALVRTGSFVDYVATEAANKPGAAGAPSPAEPVKGVALDAGGPAALVLNESCGGVHTLELSGEVALRRSLMSNSIDFGELLDGTRPELGDDAQQNAAGDVRLNASGSLSPDALTLRRRQFSLGEHLSQLEFDQHDDSPQPVPSASQRGRRPSIMARHASSGSPPHSPLSVTFATPPDQLAQHVTAHFGAVQCSDEGKPLADIAAEPPAAAPADTSTPARGGNKHFQRSHSAAELVSSLARRRSRWKTFADEYDAAWIEAIGLDANWEFIVRETKYYATLLSLLVLGVSVVQNGVVYGFSNYLVVSSGQLLNYTLFWLIVYCCYFLNEARYTLQHEVAPSLRPWVLYGSVGVVLLAYGIYSSLTLSLLSLLCFVGVVSVFYDTLYPLVLRTSGVGRPRLARSPSWYALAMKNSANAALLKDIHVWFRGLIGAIIALSVLLFLLSRLIATEHLPDMFNVAKRPLEPAGSGYEVTVGFLDLVSRDPLSSASFYVRNLSSVDGHSSLHAKPPLPDAASAEGRLGAAELCTELSPDALACQPPRPSSTSRLGAHPQPATFGPCAFSSHDGLTLIDFGLFAQLAYFRQNSAGFDEFLETFMDGFVVVNSSHTMFRSSAPETSSFFDLYNAKLNLSIITIPGTHLLSPLDILQDIDIWLEAGAFQLFSQVLSGLRFWPRDVQAYLIRIISLMDQLLPYADSRHYFQPIVEYVRQIKTSRDVVVVGHSLGGGLASIVAAKSEVRGISFSGPGIVETRKKLQIPLKNINKYTVNVIPENDIVPMVGVQGGIIYHTSCFRNGLDHCHMIQNTVCELIRKCGGQRSALMSAKKLDLQCDFLPEPNHAIGIRFRDLYGAIMTVGCLLATYWVVRGSYFAGLWTSIKPPEVALRRAIDNFRASLIQSFVPDS
eukprot:TRINITY_DN8724_c0_g1_i2.p1 TRINITY_DN8724_c0_g1~~TRINITY_DN8724_c0_g1_i2.p1  ORF type:complete len:1143 (-),score=457.05 TRINITY_DN8724_c0_g1_i2:156-3584(-)